MTNPSETFTLTVNGQRYERWEEIRVTREIDRMATDFNIMVSERFLGSAPDFPLAPFMPCTVAIGADVVLTGYIDNYLPEAEADRHSVRITGRSKTEDIIDCTPDIQGGQFAGYKLDAIARAIGQSVRQPYPIDLVVQTDVGEPFPDATIERHETGFAFLERLCRLRSILATDDEQGRRADHGRQCPRDGCAVAGTGRQRAVGQRGDLRRAALFALQSQGAAERAWQHVAGVELAGGTVGLGGRGISGRRRGR